MDNILDYLSKISNEMYELLNDLSVFNNGEIYWKNRLNGRRVKIDDYIKNGTLNCRSKEIDFEIKELIKYLLIDYALEFYSKRKDDDEFLMLLGFSINLYYVVGLYQEFGKFSIEDIIARIGENSVKECAELINEFLYKKNRERISKVIKKFDGEDAGFDYKAANLVSEYEKDTALKLLEGILGECNKNYAPDIYRYLVENDDVSHSDDILEKMIDRYPECKFSMVYQCLKDAKDFYESKGKNREVYRWGDKIGTELFSYIMNTRDYFESDTTDGKKRRKECNYAKFGLGIPRVKITPKEEFYAREEARVKDEIYSNSEISELDSNAKKYITNENILKETEVGLEIGVDICLRSEVREIFGELIASEGQLRKKNFELEKLQEQRKEMMDYYAHSWKHISYPQIVKEIAEELGNSNRVIANRLMKVYNSEKTLQRGIQLLQYISSEDEGKVSKEFKNGIAKSGVNSENCVSLQKVICDSLDLVVFKILMVESDDSRSIEKCREKWKLKRSMDVLREEYTEMFLNGNAGEEKLIEWVNDNLLMVNLNIEDEWNSVRFKDDSFAVNQFKEILVEIFTNVFLHGEKSMTLDFSSTDDEMLIYEMNECNDMVSGSKSGISTMEKVLEYINHGSNTKVLDTKLGERFEITIRINKKILIRKGR